MIQLLTVTFFCANFFALTKSDEFNNDVNNDNTLRHVSVIFRHADRAPDPVEMYPLDPYYNYTFFPYGLGGLTNQGKKREYKLGKFLRGKYNALLGKIYKPGSIYARSTDYNRTKMCLQLVLLALYPPKNHQIWNKHLYWQPIVPMKFVTTDKDWLMIPEECPEYLKERNKVENTPEIRTKIESFDSFLKILTQLTGKNMTEINDAYNLYHLFTAESAMGLSLPSWTKNIFPRGELLDAILLWYETFSKSTLQRRLNGGKLLRAIMDDMDEVRSGNDKKIMSLYSGHETNVAAILQTLGVYEPHVPQYSSAVMVELHEKNNDYFVKVYYYYGIPAKEKLLTIPYCTEECLYKMFSTLLRKVTPLDSELECDKKKNN